MTISTTTLLNSFSGNGSVVDFTYTYPINSASELLVIIKTDATGAETTKTLTSDYTVALAGDSGGTVTMGTAPASGETLFLIRNTTKTQGTDLIENDPFSAEGLEDSFDNLQMQIQEVSNAVDRSFKVSKTNSITTSEITTSAADRANKILSFDASGNVEATAFTNLDTLNEMTDVTITSPADNEVLAYDSSSTHFINQTAAEAGLVATGAVTGITSLLATDIKIGEDNETKIDFETADEIHFYAANAEQAYVADGVFGPQTDSDVDLGTTSVRWKDAYIDSITTTGNITSAGTVSFGSITDGTITATAFVDEDDMSSNSATLIPTQQSVKAYVDAKKADMQFVLEDGDGTEVQIVKDSEVKFVEGGGIDINWTDTSTGSDADPFDLTFAIDSTVATLTGSQTLTNKTLTSPVLNGTISGTSIKDEDNMASDSASHLATQQSIKAYVDAVTTSLNAQDLDVSDGSSTIGIDLDTETLGILGGTGLTSSASGNNVTLSVDAAQTQITSVGALDAGSITSGFGNIDNGSSTITTTGQIAAGSLDISGDIDVDGTTNLDVVDIDGAVDMASTLQVDGSITSSDGMTITTADNDAQLTLVSTDADADEGPRMNFVRNSGSPANNDVLARISLQGKDAGANTTSYAQLETTAVNVAQGSETGKFNIQTAVAGSINQDVITMTGSEVVINDSSNDVDFRVESDGNTHALFVDAGNNRVGINNSSPSQALDITGNLVISGISRFGNGSAASPAYQFGDDTNTGMFRASSDTLGFSTAGSERVRVDASGRLGIGTTDVSQNLESVVSNTTSIPTDASMGSTNTDTASGIGIHNENNSAVYSGINLETRTTHASRWLIGNEWKSSYNGDLFFRARDGGSTSSEILRLKSDGSVGIGTSSPNSYSGYTTLTINNATNGGIIDFEANGTLTGEIYSDNTGIGIQTVQSDDDIFFKGNDGGSTITALTLDMSAAGGATFNNWLEIPDYIYHTADSNTYFGFNANDNFELFAGGTDRLSIVGSETVFNDGSADKDFRVESNANANRFKIDGGDDVIVMGTGTVEDSIYGAKPALQLTGTDFNSSAFSIIRNAADASSPNLIFGKSRSADGNTVVQNGDDLGNITFAAADGTDQNNTAARIYAEVDGTPGANDTPGRLVFATTADGTNSATERIRITNSGKIGISESSPDTLLHITQGGEPPAEGMLLLQANSSSRQLRIQPPTNADNGFIDYRGGNLVFMDDGTEVARFQGTTGFGIGETSPLGKLHVKTADSGGSATSTADELVVEGSGDTGIQILSGASSEAGIAFGDSGDSNVGLIGYDHANNRFRFKTNDAVQWYLDSSGNWLPAATDHGIYLGVTSATASNLLNDYEEGTWTPVLGSTGSYSGQQYASAVGNYTKIGRQVTLHMKIVLTDAGTVGDFSTIFGLPFTPASTSNGSIPIAISKITITSGHSPIATWYTGGSARIYLLQQDGAGTLDQISASGVADDAQVYMTATFLV